MAAVQFQRRVVILGVVAGALAIAFVLGLVMIVKNDGNGYILTDDGNALETGNCWRDREIWERIHRKA
jgi:hypothetical protein